MPTGPGAQASKVPSAAALTPCARSPTANLVHTDAILVGSMNSVCEVSLGPRPPCVVSLLRTNDAIDRTEAHRPVNTGSPVSGPFRSAPGTGSAELSAALNSEKEGRSPSHVPRPGPVGPRGSPAAALGSSGRPDRGLAGWRGGSA